MQTKSLADQALEALRTCRDVPLPPPGERRRIRCAYGVTTGSLADALGVTPQTVRNYEAGRREPRGAIRELYAVVLENMRGEVAS